VPPQFIGMRHWYESFLDKLKTNSKDVTNLLAYNPFENKSPPKYLRVPVYKFEFTNFDERQKTGHWWKAEFLGFFPNVPRRSP